MFNFDDDIVIGFYDQVPWLLLLNLLVMFLLIFLLCYSTMFAFDSVGEEEDSQLHKLESRSNNSNNFFINDCRVLSLDDSKVCRWSAYNDSQFIALLLFLNFMSAPKMADQHQRKSKRHESSSTSRIGGCREIDEIQGGERMSATDAVTQKALSSCSALSPCHWLEIASKAFLSCLGLHTASEDSPEKQDKKHHHL